ncbi:MAG: GGDEF domain-containing protein [Aphanocapsa sp. GSE-SYN-MK-11-07L]|nr:GGDEF domain-containing protein [Aphanocapsa sp. GSE-SYN-MK-11-07L]
MPSIAPDRADPLEVMRRQFSHILFPLGALTFAGTRFVLGNQINLIDRHAMLPLGGLMLLLEGLLLGNVLSTKTIWKIGLSLIATYLIISLGYEVTQAEYYPGFSPTALWFPVVYLIAFSLFSPRQVLFFSSGYFLLCVAVILIGAFLSPLQSPKLNNAVMGFILANLFYIILLNIYNNLRSQYGQVHQMAHYDQLTGVANRHQIQALLAQKLPQTQDSPQNFSILLVDLDHFKQVNDKYGHAVGDRVLKDIAHLLAQHVRASDTLARWGGEEFLILAPTTDLAQAQHLGEKIQQVLSEVSLADQLRLTLSIGIASYRPDDTLATLLERADAALYRAKSLGRNRVELE